MPAMATRLSADKLDAWEPWVAEVNGTRKAESDDMNARHGLTEHRACLQPTPDEGYLVLVTQEGPGSDTFIANAMSSDHEFDHWFARSIAEVHEIDTSGPMPPMAARKIEPGSSPRARAVNGDDTPISKRIRARDPLPQEPRPAGEGGPRRPRWRRGRVPDI